MPVRAPQHDPSEGSSDEQEGAITRFDPLEVLGSNSEKVLDGHPNGAQKTQ